MLARPSWSRPARDHERAGHARDRHEVPIPLLISSGPDRVVMGQEGHRELGRSGEGSVVNAHGAHHSPCSPAGRVLTGMAQCRRAGAPRPASPADRRPPAGRGAAARLPGAAGRSGRRRPVRRRAGGVGVGEVVGRGDVGRGRLGLGRVLDEDAGHPLAAGDAAQARRRTRMPTTQARAMAAIAVGVPTPRGAPEARASEWLTVVTAESACGAKSEVAAAPSGVPASRAGLPRSRRRGPRRARRAGSHRPARTVRTPGRAGQREAGARAGPGGRPAGRRRRPAGGRQGPRRRARSCSGYRSARADSRPGRRTLCPCFERGGGMGVAPDVGARSWTAGVDPQALVPPASCRRSTGAFRRACQRVPRAAVARRPATDLDSAAVSASDGPGCWRDVDSVPRSEQLPAAAAATPVPSANRRPATRRRSRWAAPARDLHGFWRLPGPW